jgi:integrase
MDFRLERKIKTTTATELLKANSDLAYLNFIESIRAEQSKQKYAHSLDQFIKFCGLKGRDELSLLLLEKDVKTIEKTIITYILQLRKEGYAYATISSRLAAIFLFYTMNDIVVNRVKIGKYYGEHVKTIKDRGYTIKEIKLIIDHCDLKYKILVSLMASTGCRIGAIPLLKLSDIKYLEQERLHQIYFYTNSKKEEYYSFCTPECSKYINEYLEFRKRSGERLSNNSPLIRDDFIMDDLDHIMKPKHLSKSTFKFYMMNVLIRSGLRTTTPQISRLRTRKEVSMNHGFRKFCTTTMANNKIQPEIREMLLGHKIGLVGAYYKPTEREMLDEYLKVVDALTINEENRLKRVNQQLKIELDERFTLFASQLQDVKKKLGL